MTIKVSTDQIVNTAAAISVPSWLIAMAAQTLPLVQWFSGILAITVAILAIIRHFKDR